MKTKYMNLMSLDQTLGYIVAEEHTSKICGSMLSYDDGGTERKARMAS